ncbi:transglutaminase domain-containing protein [Limnobacter parvus]|uniref:Transglutaminase-like domain-containing protein n=1 Tax=Limnobacter parvus TaxID=2939690 RepID=A0ABT1XIG3_9BURK|nr:transglutaminase domain-containing protein [Limnobacter parvus]MCR2746072.1 hypothetical protein [Limnobacter parvus]
MPLRRVFVIVLSAALLFTFNVTVKANDHLRTQYLHSHLNRVLVTRDQDLSSKLNALVSVASNDHERAWLIYRWVTNHFKHDSHLASKIGDPKNHSLDQLYKLAGGSCAVYANVVQRLMQQAGLEVKTIYGLAKGGAVSARRNGKAVNHVWNAVKVNGEWRVIDATWGAGYVGNEGFQRDQSDLFFLIPPEQAVLSHFDEADELGQQRQFDVNYRLFSQLPEDALYAASIGFDARAILEVRRTHLNVPLVSTFDQLPGSFKVIQAPVAGRLGRTQHRFKIESLVYEELMLLQGKTWIPLQKQGRVHSLMLKPNKGELLVMGRRPKQQDFEALLAYTVN